MTLTDVFKTNCRATATLTKGNPSLAFNDLTSGLGGKNKNGVIARFSFNEFFIDLYFIENGPLAYAPNTIWINVGFDSVSFLPFSVYDILTFISPGNFKSYTYPYLYTNDVMIQSFGEINDLFKTLVPALEDISATGIKKNKLIALQKDAINKFVDDDIFKKEIEIIDASLKIREMLIRNYVEAVISHIVSGGVAEFYNGNHEKAIKKLSLIKHRTQYEENLLTALKNGSLKDYDASPFRDEKYKNYTSTAKKRTYSSGTKGLSGFFLFLFLITPVFSVILFFVYLILCHLRFNGALMYTNCDLYSIVTILLTGFMVSEIFSFHFLHKIKNLVKKKKEKNFTPDIRPKSKVLKYFTILVETIVILLLFSTVNNSLVFTKTKVAFPEESFISLKQQTLRYEYLDAVYKARGYYLTDTKFIETEHYILVAKNGEVFDLSVYPDCKTEEFEKEVLPLLLKEGVNFKEIESEKDIK